MGTVRDGRYAVRRANLADMAELLRMQLALQASIDEIAGRMLRVNPASAAKLHDYYETQIHDAHARVLVAETIGRGQVVGMGTGRVWTHADYLPPQSGELIDLWVDPEHRRRGLASRIVSRLLEFFRERRIEFLALNYVLGNGSGERFWKKLGFEHVLVTATADRAEVERSMAIASRQIVPLACSGAGDSRHRSVYSRQVLSG